MSATMICFITLLPFSPCCRHYSAALRFCDSPELATDIPIDQSNPDSVKDPPPLVVDSDFYIPALNADIFSLWRELLRRGLLNRQLNCWHLCSDEERLWRGRCASRGRS